MDHHRLQVSIYHLSDMQKKQIQTVYTTNVSVYGLYIKNLRTSISFIRRFPSSLYLKNSPCLFKFSYLFAD